jgi:hypothetical protein
MSVNCRGGMGPDAVRDGGANCFPNGKVGTQMNTWLYRYGCSQMGADKRLGVLEMALSVERFLDVSRRNVF